MEYAGYSGIDLSPGSSGVVHLDGSGDVIDYTHIAEPDSKLDFYARLRMANRIIDCFTRRPILIGLEDFALFPGSTISYQIAETAGMVKQFLVESGYPLVLIAQRKRQSFVKRVKKVTKADVEAWARENGFCPPIKARGVDGGYKKREREDLSDAFVMARMARDLAMYIAESSLPKPKDTFLDPDTGLMFNDHVRFNCEKVGLLV